MRISDWSSDVFSSDLALLGDPVIGRVDGGELLGGDLDEFLGHALGDQLVRVVLADQPAPGVLDLRVGHLAADAENRIGVALVGTEMAGADALEGMVVESEDIDRKSTRLNSSH